jgi:hypothetical protein
MKYLSDKDSKLKLITEIFAPLIGLTFEGYEMPELFIEDDNTWDKWFDLPIYLSFSDELISVSWADLDELSLSRNREIPFSLDGCQVRWCSENIPLLNNALGQKLESVSLGRGQMSVENNELEIWTRLFLHLTNGVIIEIYNALDENGFNVLSSIIEKDTIKCV